MSHSTPIYRAFPLHSPPKHVVEKIVTMALDEDLGRGDVTTQSCVHPTQEGYAHLVCREEAIWCGTDVFCEVHTQVDPKLKLHFYKKDGDLVQAGDQVASISGVAASILMAERVALNFVQRLSAIATQANKYVQTLPQNSQIKIVDTRKTTPGLRALERFAVRAGGAFNHRDDLSSAILIKDNHIQIAGGVTQAISLAKKNGPHSSRIECEVDTIEQFQEALNEGAQILLLDNFSPDEIREAVLIVQKVPAQSRPLLEVSGGITLEKIAEYAIEGVDCISVGALTHSVRSVDLGLDWS